MDKRNALRAGAVSATVTLMMLLSSPAMAFTRDDGDDPGSGLSVGQAIGLYVLIPIAAFVIIAALAAMPYGKGKKN
ncbi:hypothetical protein AB0C76_19135 [Kitasatospora sp. NPDC048722]|uniref:hypothetical protein n=1 Tax=Kitasatospora sp. NPDC048722 TaxID=3155639 RepID=UPI0033F2A3AF